MNFGIKDFWVLQRIATSQGFGLQKLWTNEPSKYRVDPGRPIKFPTIYWNWPPVTCTVGLLCPSIQRSWKWGILVSPCPSVRLWTKSCPLCIFNNTRRIHYIFAHLIKRLQKVCRVWSLLYKIKKIESLANSLNLYIWRCLLLTWHPISWGGGGCF